MDEKLPDFDDEVIRQAILVVAELKKQNQEAAANKFEESNILCLKIIKDMFISEPIIQAKVLTQAMIFVQQQFQGISWMLFDFGNKRFLYLSETEMTDSEAVASYPTLAAAVQGLGRFSRVNDKLDIPVSCCYVCAVSGDKNKLIWF